MRVSGSTAAVRSRTELSTVSLDIRSSDVGRRSAISAAFSPPVSKLRNALVHHTLVEIFSNVSMAYTPKKSNQGLGKAGSGEGGQLTP